MLDAHASDFEVWEYAVEHAFKNKLDEPIRNGEDTRVAKLISCIFKYANNKLWIHSGSLGTGKNHQNCSVYKSAILKEAAANFLDKDNSSLTILVSENDVDLDQSSFLRYLFDRCKNFHQKVTIKFPKENDVSLEKLPHFTVSDSFSYRLEYDDLNRHAIAQAYNKDMSLSLQKIITQALSDNDLRTFDTLKWI